MPFIEQHNLFNMGQHFLLLTISSKDEGWSLNTCLISAMTAHFEEFCACQNRPPQTKPVVVNVQWSPPNHGIIKVNFDAETNSQPHNGINCSNC